jgi:hypothetical protein
MAAIKARQQKEADAFTNEAKKQTKTQKEKTKKGDK